MPAWNSSSLAVSEGGLGSLERHKGSGLLKNGLIRHSKQHMAEKKIFGSRRGMHGKDLQIGKKFRRKGNKDLGGTKAFKSSGISPSVEEFDKMMGSSVTHNPNKKKSLFNRKSFG